MLKDGFCLDMPSSGRFLEQIYVPPGRDPWTPGVGFPDPEHENLSVNAGSVTLQHKLIAAL